MQKFGVVSLGCSKNRVDTEIMLGIMQRAGFTITADASEADIIAVNTCGFIESAKQEAIDTILEMAEYKKGACKKLIVTGCLSQRYGAALKEAMPEIDIAIGINEYRLLPQLLGHGQCRDDARTLFERRTLSQGHFAYLRIADGCNNRCSYCAIPEIRGVYRSRLIEEIISEAEALCRAGVKELVVIAQDITKFGVDLYDCCKLEELIKEIAKLDVQWIRLMYAYPGNEIESLAELIPKTPKLVQYLDLPIQHCNDEILAHMNRAGSKAELMRQIDSLKKAGIMIRTSLMTGFPGETETQHKEMLAFIEECEFDHTGVFMFSPEEGTNAATMSAQISESVKMRRYHELMSAQQRIARKKNETRVGKVYQTIIDDVSVEKGFCLGRTFAEAPEVDGIVEVRGHGMRIGEFYNVRIVKAFDYDLIGELDEYA